MKKLFGISMLTITCLYGILAALVIFITLVCGGEVLYGIVGSLLVLVIQFLIAPWLTDLSMRFFYKAKFGEAIPSYLQKFIEEECQKYNVKFPKIGIIDDGAPNAFTYGRTKKDARLIVTRGIFDLLSEEETKAVVGHEMGHIVHMDMLVMTVAQVVPLVLYAIFEICTKSEKNDKDNGSVALIGYIAYVLYIICQYIILWLSRTREYYADSFSIEETRNPNAMASALVKVGFGLSINSSKDENKRNVSKNNALGIFDVKASKALSISAVDESGEVSKDHVKNAMKWEMWNPWAKWFEFNSTHPLISKRLLAISKRSKEFNQEEYIVFDLQKPESYLDNFLLEVLISFLPGLFFVVTAIMVLIAVVSEDNMFISFAGIGLLLTSIFGLVKFNRAHRQGYKDTTVRDLLGEVNVSHITSVPCIVKGKIIGRGDPGCIFSEDYVVQDNTGIMFVDYNQPLKVLNKLFAIFKSGDNIDKEVTIKGWYRRSPVPYIEIFEYSINGTTKRIHTYMIGKVLYIILLLVSLVGIAFGFM